MPRTVPRVAVERRFNIGKSDGPSFTNHEFLDKYPGAARFWDMCTVAPTPAPAPAPVLEKRLDPFKNQHFTYDEVKEQYPTNFDAMWQRMGPIQPNVEAPGT